MSAGQSRVDIAEKPTFSGCSPFRLPMFECKCPVICPSERYRLVETMCNWEIDCLFYQIVCYFVSEDAAMTWDPLNVQAYRALSFGLYCWLNDPVDYTLSRFLYWIVQRLQRRSTITVNGICLGMLVPCSLFLHLFLDCYVDCEIDCNKLCIISYLSLAQSVSVHTDSFTPWSGKELFSR